MDGTGPLFPLSLQSPELAVDVPTSPPLSAAVFDEGLQCEETLVNLVHSWLPATRPALVDPSADALMPARLVAPLTGSHLVLEPAGSALDLRHQMLRCWPSPSLVEGRPTPNADLAVSGHRFVKSCTAPGLPNYTVHRRLLSSPH